MEKKNAFKMVELVLDDASREIGERFCFLIAVEVRELNLDVLRSLYLHVDLGKAEAAFFTGDLGALLADLGVDEDVIVSLLLVPIQCAWMKSFHKPLACNCLRPTQTLVGSYQTFRDPGPWPCLCRGTTALNDWIPHGSQSFDNALGGRI